MTRANGRLSWKPKHSSRGEIYCSPACGLGCTRASYEAAVLASSDLALFHFKGWMPEVWENLGWYWKITKGKAEISPRAGGDGYHCILNTQPPFSTSGETPQAALELVLSQARTALTTLQADIKELT